jgi:hypothetical protein
MYESLTMIEQANKSHHHFYFDRSLTQTPQYSSSKKDHLKTLSFDVYSSRHLKLNRRYPSRELILPPIDKDDNHHQHQKKRISYRTSVYHSKPSNSTEINLSQLTARGIKPVVLTTIRDDDTVYNLQRHHAPPPSPSDDQIERLFFELNRAEQTTPQLSLDRDGYIPYRLPALNQSARRRQTKFNIPSKEIKSTLSNYGQIF